MAKTGKACLTLAAALLAVVGLMQWQTNQRLDRELDALRGARDRSEVAERQVDQLGAEVGRLQDELSVLQAALSDAVLNPPNPVQGGANDSEQGNAAVNASPGGQRGAGPEPAFNEILRARLQSPEVREHMAADLVQVQYGEFIESLDLSEQDEQTLVKLMEEVAYQRVNMSARLESGEIDPAEQARLSDPYLMTRTLRDFLTEDEMEAFEQYEADAPVRVRARLEANQYVALGTGAPGLTDENRAHVAAVLAEEMTSPQGQAFMQGGDGLAQIHALAKRRLEGSLDAEQLAIVSAFLDRQSRMRELLGP